jgi:hypothetical protein
LKFPGFRVELWFRANSGFSAGYRVRAEHRGLVQGLGFKAGFRV